MNKTVSIHLAGVFFHIDEAAYEKLYQYLENIKSRFGDAQERQEIMNDIEARIAELFTQKLDKSRQVVNTADVEEVIAVMGEPQDYTASETFEEAPNLNQRDAPKRLYRDPDLKILGGVSGGLSHYFNVDVVWIRIIWVLLVLAGFGSGIILYIVLWAVVPEAKTTSDKLSMKGFKANLSNIEKNVKKNFEEATQRLKDTNFSETGKRVANAAKSGASGFADLLQNLLSILAKFFGVLLVIVALSTLVALTIAFFTGLFVNFSDNFWSQITAQVFDSGWPFWSLALALLFLIGVPFFFLLQAGLSLVSGGVRTAGKLVNFVLLSLMLASLAYLIAFGITEGAKSTHYEYAEFPLSQVLTVSDSLVVEVNGDSYDSHRFFDTDLVFDKDKGVYETEKNVEIRLLPANDSLFSVKIIKKGYGLGENGEKLDYQFTIDGRELMLDSHFNSMLKKYNGHEEVEVFINIPTDKTVKLSYALRNLYRHQHGDLPYLERDMYDQFIYFSEGAWQCTGCEGEF